MLHALRPTYTLGSRKAEAGGRRGKKAKQPAPEPLSATGRLLLGPREGKPMVRRGKPWVPQHIEVLARACRLGVDGHYVLRLRLLLLLMSQADPAEL